MRVPIALFFLLLPVAVAHGCGGNSSLQSGTYRGNGVRYRIGPLASTWRRVDINTPEQNDLAFSNEALDALVQVNSSCSPELDLPLPALTNHLLIGFTDRNVHQEGTLSLDGREALRTHVTAKLDGVLRELLFYVLKKNGCVYDFALVSRPGTSFERASVDFEALVRGFHTQEAAP